MKEKCTWFFALLQPSYWQLYT